MANAAPTGSSRRHINEAAETRDRDIAALARAKETERRMLRRKKGLARIAVLNGYVITNHPETFGELATGDTNCTTTKKNH